MNTHFFSLKSIFDILKNKEMSTTWYECKIKYRKTDETGGQKTTEPYLVDALSYTEAESRINEEMSAYISEEFKITNIKVANYAEIHPLKIVIAGLNQKFLYWLMMKSGKERRLVCIF
jgi:hypothetical protein